VRRVACAIAVVVLSQAAACSKPKAPPNPLVPASTTMVTAWQIPLDPLTQPLPADA